MGFAIGMADMFRKPLAVDIDDRDISTGSDFNSIPMNSRKSIYTTEDGPRSRKPYVQPRQRHTPNNEINEREERGRIQEHYI